MVLLPGRTAFLPCMIMELNTTPSVLISKLHPFLFQYLDYFNYLPPKCFYVSNCSAFIPSFKCCLVERWQNQMQAAGSGRMQFQVAEQKWTFEVPKDVDTVKNTPWLYFVYPSLHPLRLPPATWYRIRPAESTLNQRLKTNQHNPTKSSTSALFFTGELKQWVWGEPQGATSLGPRLRHFCTSRSDVLLTGCHELPRDFSSFLHTLFL